MMGLRQEISRVVAVAIAIALTGATADAQNTSADILQALTPSTLTSKSLSAPPAITEEDQVFVKSLAGKAITVEARQQVAEIIEVYELPQIDLTVEFAFNSATLSAQAKATLNKLGEAISASDLSKSTFVIAGHTDAVGGGDFNQKLSERRAIAARDFLISTYQIPSAQLVAIGFGEEQLKNSVDPNAAENRRVQVVNVSG